MFATQENQRFEEKLLSWKFREIFTLLRFSLLLGDGNISGLLPWTVRFIPDGSTIKTCCWLFSTHFCTKLFLFYFTRARPSTVNCLFTLSKSFFFLYTTTVFYTMLSRVRNSNRYQWSFIRCLSFLSLVLFSTLPTPQRKRRQSEDGKFFCRVFKFASIVSARFHLFQTELLRLIFANLFDFWF